MLVGSRVGYRIMMKCAEVGTKQWNILPLLPVYSAAPSTLVTQLEVDFVVLSQDVPDSHFSGLVTYTLQRGLIFTIPRLECTHSDNGYFQTC